ncbi:ankyrin repeat domain protein [Nitzschia inconspicua]|uniref:Ankyrin repeat domain protein n=1 Tax=Nitzschia inconspicua TaxID=303405 RepID=A0A9K3PUH4_9STRA|nr:ankyrin repeat domain protein [Nitzschia inconspicua]
MVSWGEEVANHASDFAVASSVVEQVEEDSHEMNSDVKSCGKSSLPCRFRLDLIPFAQNCCSPADYDLLKEHILDPSLNGPNMHFSPNNNEEFSFQSDESNISDDGELRTTLLHATLQSKGNKRLPLDIIQCIVDMSGVDMVTYQDENGATPLHLAISELPRRIDIIQYLLRKAPENVLKENDLHLRPIDLMSHKIIMGEEGVRYDGENYTQDHELGPMWEAVDCLVKASTDPNNYDTLDTPLLHSCLTSNDFPFALMQRAIERYADQLEIPDENGDLPLHLVVSRPPATPKTLTTRGISSHSWSKSIPMLQHSRIKEGFRPWR